MLLQLSIQHTPASDLGYLFHKHPDRFQSFSMSFGKAHAFYPELLEDRCTFALLLEVDPIGLVRNEKGPAGENFALQQYVNDRPYVSSSFLSSAIAQVLGSALNGNSKDRPDLTEKSFPIEIQLPTVSSRGGENLIRSLFEPLGYELEISSIPLDTNFPDWGNSRYFSLTLRHTLPLYQTLSHLYILLPVMDNDKHYWMAQDEVDKLSEKGKGWLESHPQKEQIVKRYLRNLAPLTRLAFQRLVEIEDEPEEQEVEMDSAKELEPISIEKKKGVHETRLQLVIDAIKESGATTVLDLGCGEGKLLKMLLKEKQFSRIVGMDISFRSLQIASEKLHYSNFTPKQKERLQLFQSSLTYRDKRLEGFEAAAIVEVIEHLDEPRLEAFERAVFEFAKPHTVVLTTPNGEYNVKFENLPSGKFRHNDHRFEWTRAQFEQWATKICTRFGYQVVRKDIIEIDEQVGGISQMAIFTKI